MPLFYQHTINATTRLAVWHITEQPEFFTEHVSLKNTVTHPHKRLQHLAGRYLLKHLQPDFPVDSIRIEPSKKPVLPENKYHFSISHCGDYAAAIISEKNTVGIDVEIITPKIEKVETKFLNEEELILLEKNNSLGKHIELATLFWSAKEAMFKWYGKGSLSFKQNLLIRQLDFAKNEGVITAQFSKEFIQDLKIEYRLFDSLCLAWVAE
ncbi:MAG: 4'-phosphopantetheinyl transferase superfamily protein [Ginsengibacter sp.]